MCLSKTADTHPRQQKYSMHSRPWVHKNILFHVNKQRVLNTGHAVITLQILCLRESRGVCHWPEFLNVGEPKICNDYHRMRNTVFLGDIYDSFPPRGFRCRRQMMQTLNTSLLLLKWASGIPYFQQNRWGPPRCEMREVGEWRKIEIFTLYQVLGLTAQGR